MCKIVTENYECQLEDNINMVDNKITIKGIYDSNKTCYSITLLQSEIKMKFELTSFHRT